MKLLTPREVASLLYTAGWGKRPIDEYANAIRVAFAESGTGKRYVSTQTGYKLISSDKNGAGFECCDAEMVNTNTNGTRDLGLMQINDTHRAFLGNPTDAQLFDPAYNAAAAFRLYKADSYSYKSWTSYVNESYLDFHQEAAWGLVLSWLERKGRPWLIT